MDPFSLALAALAIYGLVARGRRHPTPEEWVALKAAASTGAPGDDFILSDFEVAEYADVLRDHSVVGDQAAGLLSRIASLQQSLLQQHGKVYLESDAGSKDVSYATDAETAALAVVSDGDWGCPPTFVEGSGDFSGQCVPSSPETSGVIGRGLTRGGF